MDSTEELMSMRFGELQLLIEEAGSAADHATGTYFDPLWQALVEAVRENAAAAGATLVKAPHMDFDHVLVTSSTVELAKVDRQRAMNVVALMRLITVGGNHG